VSSVDDTFASRDDSFEEFLAGTGLSSSNYDALLIGWERLDLADGLIFDAGSSQYTADAEAARQAIINDHNWEINDGGLMGGEGETFVPLGAGLTGVEQSSSDWGDFDSDGDLDLVIAGSGGVGVGWITKIYENKGNGSFESIGAGLPGVKNGFVGWGDFDSDGDLDLVLTGQTSTLNSTAKIYENQNGSFEPVGADLTGVDDSSSDWGDFDSDDDLDLVITGQVLNGPGTGGENIARIYENEGEGDFSPVDAELEGVENSSSRWGDFDSDEDLDLVITGATSIIFTVATIYENQDDGTFEPIESDLTDVENGSSEWGDYDSDGDLDLVITGSETATIYENEGDGSFSQINAGLEGVQLSSSGWGDYDGDEDLDLVVTGVNSSSDLSTTVYENQNGTFSAVETGLTDIKGSSDWGDYDSDGDLDLLLTGDSGEDAERIPTATIFENQSGSSGTHSPTGLVAASGNGKVDLTWASAENSDPAGYNVYRSTTSFSDISNATKINTSLLGDPSYTDSDVTGGTEYFYRVTAVDSDGNESSPSNEASAVLSPGPFADWPDLEDPSITLKIVSPEIDVSEVDLKMGGGSATSSITEPVSSGFAEFPDPDPSFSPVPRIAKIRLLGPDGQVVGYLPFRYTQSDFSSGIGIDAVIYVHDEPQLQPLFGRWSDEWDYYTDDCPGDNGCPQARPLSMLIPPGGSVDNVEIEEKSPVVLVHGVSGRYPSWGGIDEVRELTEHLNGEEYDGWQFYYPENQNITKSGPLLAKAIHRLQNNLGYGPDQSFDILAHSMGGLVSRHYIQRMGIASTRSTYSQVLNFDSGGPREDIGKFLMLGTPNHGSYAGYRCTAGVGLCTGLDILGRKDMGAPAFRQMTPGSKFLSDLNRSSTASEPYSPASTLVLAGIRNPKEAPVPIGEIPDQDDGVVAISSAGLLDLNVPLAVGDFAHSASLDRDCDDVGDCDPRLNEDTQNIITSFLSEDYDSSTPSGLGAITGFWEGASGEQVDPQPIYVNGLSANTDEGMLTVDAEETSIQSLGIVPSRECPFSVGACVRVGGDQGMEKVPNQNRFFSQVDIADTPIPFSLGFRAATRLGAKAPRLATVQRFLPGIGGIGWKPVGLVSLPTKYLHTTQARLELDDVQRIVAEASGFTPSIGTSNSSGNGSTASSKSTAPGKAQTTETQFQVDTATDTLAFWLARDSAGDVSGHNMRLTAPDGTVIDSSTAKSDPEFGYTQDLDVGYAIYRVEDPAAGRWTVRYDASVPMSVSAPVMSTVNLRASVPDSAFITGETVPVRVSFSGQNTYDDKEMTAQLRVENQEGGTTTLQAIDLDESAPTTYEGDFSPTYVGSYQIAVDFSAKVGGEPVRRRTTETVEVTGDSSDTVPDPPPAPTGLTAQLDGTDGVSLNWSLEETGSVEEFHIYRDTIPNPTRQVAAVLSSKQISYTDSEIQGGETYYYRVTATGAEGVESDFAEEVSIFTYPSSLSLNIQRSFGSPSSEEGYRLVALPGATDQSLETALDGEAGADWQAYWDDGSSQDYFQKYDGSEAFNFRPGRGFWVLKKSDWTVQRSVETVALSGKDQTLIPVHEGWNIISNPFGGHVPWGEVDAANSDSLRVLWRFDGNFAQADTFRSAKTGEAFYFLNDTGLDSLSVPYPSNPSTRAKQKEGSSLLAISAQPKGSESPTSTVKFGFDEKAAEGLERLDQPAPPGQFSAVSLRLKAPGKTPKRQRLLMAERRPPNAGPGGGHTFDLRLRSQAKGPVQISANRLEAAEGSEVRLLHPSTGQSYDLREKAATIEETDSTALRLAVGSAAYVQDQAEKVIPDEVTLTSYPNPTSGQATLEYTLPEAKEVRLTVYDVLGRQVAVLDEGRKEAGRHEAHLDGTGLSSGVYFGRLRVGDKTRTQKITVVR